MTEIVIGFLVILGLVFLILFTIGMSKTQMYLQDIIEIETLIRCGPVNDENRYVIIKLFQAINNNNKDKERTRRAWDKFVGKYKR
jgi:hypothetical protein